MTIHIVFGRTGEYDDFRDWVVKAFTSQEKAQDLVTAASKRAREIFQTWAITPDGDTSEQNEFDPEMEMDYTGTLYYITKCELE